MNKTLRRSVAALATAFACLAIMASPASATAHNAVINSGTITAIGVNAITETITLGGSTGTGCGSTLVVDDGTGSTADVTNFSSVGRFKLSTSGNYYIATISRLASTPGTLSGTTVASASVQLRVDVFLAANNTATATDCATTGTRVCRLTTTLVFGGSVSSNPIVTSTTGTLNAPAATIVVTPPCGVPFTTFNTGTASVSSLAIHVTT